MRALLPSPRPPGPVTLLLLALLAAGIGVLLAPSEAAAQCRVCESCEQDSDCGSGYVCRNVGAPAGMVCTQICTTGSCPGDSVCYTFTFDGNTEMICLNPDANNQGNCPGSYTCVEDNMACTGLGTDCSGGASACSQLEAFTCLTTTDANGNSQSYCTCECSSTADCDGATCGSASGSMYCMVDSTTGPCADVMCPMGQTCDPGTGNCVDDPNDLCEGVMCSGGAVCSPATGTCIGGDDTTTGDAMSDTSAPTDTGGQMSDTQTGGDTASGGDTMTGTDMSTPPGNFVITSVNPTSAPNDRETLVQVNGNGFVAGMTLRLEITNLTNVTVASPTVATATVPAGITPGTYDLNGQLPDGSLYTLPSAFQVTGDGMTMNNGGSSGDAGCGCGTVRTSDERPAWPLGLALALGGMLIAVRRRRTKR